LASNPVVNAGSSLDRLKQILRSVTDAALFVEQLLAAMDADANAVEIERLTEAFGHLAAVAIQAAHAVEGRQITPESVLQLLPVDTPLHPSEPAKGSPVAPPQK
jgi:protein-disulfide isomerase-like protein with CxxC motif